MATRLGVESPKTISIEEKTLVGLEADPFIHNLCVLLGWCPDLYRSALESGAGVSGGYDKWYWIQGVMMDLLAEEENRVPLANVEASIPNVLKDTINQGASI